MGGRNVDNVRSIGCVIEYFKYIASAQSASALSLFVVNLRQLIIAMRAPVSEADTSRIPRGKGWADEWSR